MEDTPQGLLLTTEGLVAAGVYLITLLALGWMGNRAQKEKTLADFYLGGRSLGIFVLLPTLYATQYSGNTLIGFAGKAYREGFTILVSVTFMMAILAVYLLYAPRLHKLSRSLDFITLSDFIMHRFRSRTFSVLVAISGIVAMANYILTNLKAIGLAVVSATGGRVGMAEGIIWLAVIILIYETLGGLRSVAWTDVLQGVILLTGCAVIFTAIMVHFDGINGLTKSVREVRPEFWQAPPLRECFGSMSTLIVVALGIAIYPHAIQRIYAAKDSSTLRRSFQIMVFLPLITSFFMVLVGIVGNAAFPNLSREESEGVTLLMLNELSVSVPGARLILILFLMAVFAAIMSTVDSALLAISSMITHDLYRPMRPDKDQKHLTKVGKFSSWIIMAVVVAAAILLPQTIWRLFEIKLELLMQIAPALLLGIHWKRMKTSAALWGFVAGTALTLVLTIPSGMPTRPLGVHAGLLGLALNLLVLAIIQKLGASQDVSEVQSA